MTAGDVDADWEDAYSVGDEAPGGDNPTPDQDRVDDIGKALGVQYEDNEELKGVGQDQSSATGTAGSSTRRRRTTTETGTDCETAEWRLRIFLIAEIVAIR